MWLPCRCRLYFVTKRESNNRYWKAAKQCIYLGQHVALSSFSSNCIGFPNSWCSYEIFELVLIFELLLFLLHLCDGVISYLSYLTPCWQQHVRLTMHDVRRWNRKVQEVTHQVQPQQIWNHRHWLSLQNSSKLKGSKACTGDSWRLVLETFHSQPFIFHCLHTWMHW